MSTVATHCYRPLRSVLLVFFLGFVATAAPALAQETDSPEQGAFGIRPVSADDQVPESYSYFVHTIDAGSTRTDAVMVLNEGTVPIQLDLYVADARTAINGGTAFANTSVASTEASSWVTVDKSQVSLQPGEQEIVPFTIDVPSQAASGEYIAGIVVEAEPAGVDTADGEGTQFGVEVVRRAGVAVVIEVPGPQVINLTTKDLRVRELTDEGTLFSFTVRNTGTVMLQGSGVFSITDPDGDEVAAISFDMDTVLPGDIGLFLLPYAEALPDGDYQLWYTLDYQPVLGAERARAITFGPIDTSIIGGQPAGASGVYPEVQPETPDPLFIPAENSFAVSPVLLVFAIIAAVVLIGAIALLLREPLGRRMSVRRSRRRSTQPQDRTRKPRSPAVPSTPPQTLATVPDPFPPDELYDDEPAVDDGEPTPDIWAPDTTSRPDG